MKLALLLGAVLPCAALLAQDRPALVLSQTIPLPGGTLGFNHHSADAKRHRIYLCASSDKTVEVVDLGSGRVEQTLPGDKPSATCYVPDLDLICVSRGPAVQLYDAGSLVLRGTVPMPANIDEMHYDPRSGQLVAGCMSAPNEGVAMIDLARRAVLGEIKASPPQGFALESDGSRIFVCTPKVNQISVLDREKGTVTGWRLVDSPFGYPIAYDAATRRLFVGSRHPAKLQVLDTTSGRQVASVDIGNDTDDLSWDAARRRVYVACGEGLISVVQQDDPDHYRDIQTLQTAPGARNCGFIPETGEFYVTVPQKPGQAAALLVYRTQPR